MSSARAISWLQVWEGLCNPTGRSRRQLLFTEKLLSETLLLQWLRHREVEMGGGGHTCMRKEDLPSDVPAG